MRTKPSTELIRHGEFVAEVTVELIPGDEAWGPYLSLDDVERLERVRKALNSGDIAMASKDSRIYRLVSVELE